MKMKKLFAGLVATGMVAAMGTSAMAASITAEYKDGAVTVNEAATIAAEENNVGSQMTVLIFKSDLSAAPTATNDNIVYINQDVASADLFTAMGVKDNSTDETIILEDGTYIVRIGGANIEESGIYEGTFTVENNTIIYGDINNDTKVNVLDRVAFNKYFGKWEGFTADDINYAAADLNTDTKVNVLDRVVFNKYFGKWEGYETLPVPVN